MGLSFGLFSDNRHNHNTDIEILKLLKQILVNLNIFSVLVPINKYSLNPKLMFACLSHKSISRNLHVFVFPTQNDIESFFR